MGGVILNVRQPITIVTVGRLSYEKNFLTAARAMAAIDSEDVQFIMIGDGPQKEEVQTVVHDHVNIKLIGAITREEVLKILAQADLIIMPSLWEGRSILQLEAMAFDLPMIISDVPGLREPLGAKKLEDNEEFRKAPFGYIVKTENPGAYVSVIRDFLSSREGNSSMREYVRRISFDSDITGVVGKYMEVYSEVVSG